MISIAICVVGHGAHEQVFCPFRQFGYHASAWQHGWHELSHGWHEHGQHA
jgi:hypothetical protein